VESVLIVEFGACADGRLSTKGVVMQAGPEAGPVIFVVLRKDRHSALDQDRSAS
jgi:hypothetical protein